MNPQGQLHITTAAAVVVVAAAEMRLTAVHHTHRLAACWGGVG